MGTVLILKDGKREIVTKDRHFTDLVREYMGEDAAKFYEDRLADIFDTVNEAKQITREGSVCRNNFDAIYEVLNGVFYD